MLVRRRRTCHLGVLGTVSGRSDGWMTIGRYCLTGSGLCTSSLRNCFISSSSRFSSSRRFLARTSSRIRSRSNLPLSNARRSSLRTDVRSTTTSVCVTFAGTVSGTNGRSSDAGIGFALNSRRFRWRSSSSANRAFSCF
ncbi:hypothetical protein FBU59_001113 [Linderina macrospora]|uniref:Uncharacterized protein n=1 Tax=Linderina macrospora TaxID=4868 RepID=A0ACC1JEZ7_9FUNG|nr:hypothetical protein FBU59_001113 [Linderina macrospora]